MVRGKEKHKGQSDTRRLRMVYSCTCACSSTKIWMDGKRGEGEGGQ